ncbi:hypothetical protein [Escherichia coli]
MNKTKGCLIANFATVPKKWLPDIVMPPNYTGPQRWQKLNG